MMLAVTSSFPWGLELAGAPGIVLGVSVLRQVWRQDYDLRNWQRDSAVQSGLIPASLPSVSAWTLMSVGLGLLSIPIKHHTIAGVLQLVITIAIALAILVFFVWTVIAFLAYEKLPLRFLPPCLRNQDDS
jgi:hypothetical protein